MWTIISLLTFLYFAVFSVLLVSIILLILLVLQNILKTRYILKLKKKFWDCLIFSVLIVHFIWKVYSKSLACYLEFVEIFFCLRLFPNGIGHKRNKLGYADYRPFLFLTSLHIKSYCNFQMLFTNSLQLSASD